MYKYTKDDLAHMRAAGAASQVVRHSEDHSRQVDSELLKLKKSVGDMAIEWSRQLEDLAARVKALERSRKR